MPRDAVRMTEEDYLLVDAATLLDDLADEHQVDHDLGGHLPTIPGASGDNTHDMEDDMYMVGLMQFKIFFEFNGLQTQRRVRPDPPSDKTSPPYSLSSTVQPYTIGKPPHMDMTDLTANYLVIGKPMLSGKGRVWTSFEAELRVFASTSTFRPLIIEWDPRFWNSSSISRPAHEMITPRRRMSSMPENLEGAHSHNVTNGRYATQTELSEDRAQSSVASSSPDTNRSLPDTASTPASSASRSSFAQVRNVVVKICHLASKSDHDASPSELLGSIRREAQMYETHLESLQGDVIPSYMGLYVSQTNADLKVSRRKHLEDFGSWLMVLELLSPQIFFDWTDAHDLDL